MPRAATSEADKAKKIKDAEAAAKAREAHIKTLTPEQKSEFIRKEKNDKFVKLANQRVPKAAEAIRLVTSLTAPNYSFTPEQKEKIINKLQDTLDDLKNKFNGVKEAAKDSFSL